MTQKDPNHQPLTYSYENRKKVYRLIALTAIPYLTVNLVNFNVTTPQESFYWLNAVLISAYAILMTHIYLKARAKDKKLISSKYLIYELGKAEKNGTRVRPDQLNVHVTRYALDGGKYARELPPRQRVKPTAVPRQRVDSDSSSPVATAVAAGVLTSFADDDRQPAACPAPVPQSGGGGDFGGGGASGGWDAPDTVSASPASAPADPPSSDSSSSSSDPSSD